MSKNVFNPYLPSYEYIPDGEPHVFGDRLYIFGSHDKFNGKSFCLLDYVCWSAPSGAEGRIIFPSGKEIKVTSGSHTFVEEYK